MDVFALAERAMRMDEESWARHANPWSVWTRAAILPLMVLAIWSRFWIGWWALAPVAALAVFAMVNPRLFPPPRNPDNWASRATFSPRATTAWRGCSTAPSAASCSPSPSARPAMTGS